MSDTDEQKASAVADAEDIDSLKVEEKEKLAAAEEAYEKKQAASANGSALEDSGHPDQRHDRRGEKKMPWVPGVILIGLGVIFLLNNITGFSIDNWWALFIMIPAVGSFSKAWDRMRSEGEMTRDVWSAIAGGMVFTLVASAFLFNLDWGLIWPAFLIIGGLGLLLGARKAW